AAAWSLALVGAAVGIGGAGASGRRAQAGREAGAVRVGAVDETVAVVVDAIVADFRHGSAGSWIEEGLHRRKVEGERAVHRGVVHLVAVVVHVGAARPRELPDDLARAVHDRRAAAPALRPPR